MSIAAGALISRSDYSEMLSSRERFMKKYLSHLFVLAVCLTVTGCVVEPSDQANKNAVPHLHLRHSVALTDRREGGER